MAIRCLRCGATNGDGADWCGQCYEPLASAPPPPPPPPPPQVAPSPPPARERPVGEGPPREPMWTCPACEGSNPIAADTCSACGTAMVRAFGGGATDGPVDESAVRMWSALPGFGHMKAGAGLIGGAIVLVVAMAGAFGATLVGGERTRGVGMLVLVVGAATWVASAWDVERWVRTRSDWLLQPRILSGVAGVVLMLLLIGVSLAV